MDSGVIGNSGPNAQELVAVEFKHVLARAPDPVLPMVEKIASVVKTRQDLVVLTLAQVQWSKMSKFGAVQGCFLFLWQLLNFTHTMCFWKAIVLHLIILCSKSIFSSLAVDGNWAEWTEWRECSATCGGGFHSRSRICTAPKHGGKNCSGKPDQTRPCNTQSCPGTMIHTVTNC